MIPNIKGRVTVCGTRLSNPDLGVVYRVGRADFEPL